MADAFTFSQPSPQQTTRGMGSGQAVGPVNVGAEYLSKGMSDVGAALAKAIEYNRALQYNQQQAGSMLSQIPGFDGGTSAAGAGGVGTGAANAPAAGSGGAATGGKSPLPAPRPGAWSSNPFLSTMVAAESGGREGPGVRGDGGLAQGYFQIHPATWTRYGGAGASPEGASDVDQMAVAQRIPFNQFGKRTRDFLHAQFGDFDNNLTVGQLAQRFGGRPTANAADMPAANAQPTASTDLPPGAPPPDKWGGDQSQPGNQGPELMGSPGGPPNQGPELVGARAGGEGFQPPAQAPTPTPRPANLGQQPIPPNMQAMAPAPAQRPPAPMPQQPGPVGGNLLSQGPGGSGLSMYGGGGGSPGQAAVASAMAPRSPMPQFSSPATGLLGAGPAAAPPSGPAAAQQPGGGAPNVIPGIYSGAGGQQQPGQQQPGQQQPNIAAMDPQKRALAIWAANNANNPLAQPETRAKALETWLQMVHPTYKVEDLGVDKDGTPLKGLVDPYSQQPVALYRNGQLVPVGQGAGAAGGQDQPPPGVNYTSQQWAQLSPLMRKAAAEDAAKRAQMGIPTEAERDQLTQSITKNSEYSEASVATTAYNAMVALSKTSSPTQAEGLIDGLAKINNPTRGVSVGQYNINQDIQSLPAELAGQIRKELSNQGFLSQQTIAQMIQSAGARVDALMEKANAFTDLQKRNVKQMWPGVDPNDIVPAITKNADYDPQNISRYFIDKNLRTYDKFNGLEVDQNYQPIKGATPYDQPDPALGFQLAPDGYYRRVNPETGKREKWLPTTPLTPNPYLGHP